MKKVILVLVLSLMTSVMFAQADSTKVVSKFTPYVGIGLSLTNGNDFTNQSYPSVEVGVMRSNYALGLAIGRQNLNFNQDAISKYYFEPKVTASVPVGSLSLNAILGWGMYIDTPYSFIEYGAGLSYGVGNLTYALTYSNFDKVNYLTPSISYSFN
jgi:opacity protein-like surface antigen